MRATAEQKWDEEEASLDPSGQAAPPERQLRSLRAGEELGEGDASFRWNVLAEELVAYPPRHQRLWLEPREESSRPAASYADAWLERELAELARRRLQGLVRPLPAPADGSEELASPRPRAAPARRSAPTRPLSPLSPAGCPRTKTRVRPAPERGLRRLLPGVATLGFFVALWFGVGALAAGAHSGPVVRLPGSVPVAHGYAYVARPGDTLWSIAARVEPGRDPRPLVDQLEQQIHGGLLQPGERLLLPR